MQIYLLRHGTAEEARTGQADADRALTQEGQDKLRRVLRRAKAAGARPSSIFSSPLRRALETAAIALEVLEHTGKVIEWHALVPQASPEDLWQEIRQRTGDSAILLASHEPLMSTAAAHLLGSPALQVDMKKAALVRVDCERLGRDPRGVLKWMLTPGVCE